jgi:hypothetical protein
MDAVYNSSVLYTNTADDGIGLLLFACVYFILFVKVKGGEGVQTERFSYVIIGRGKRIAPTPQEEAHSILALPQSPSQPRLIADPRLHHKKNYCVLCVADGRRAHCVVDEENNQIPQDVIRRLKHARQGDLLTDGDIGLMRVVNSN